MNRGESARPTAEQLEALARDVRDALNRRDSDALLAFVHPDYEYRSLLAGVEGRTYSGPRGMRDWLSDVDDGFAGARWELIEVLSGEGRPIVVFRMHARGRGSDVPFDLVTAQVWTFREGKIWRSEVYRSTEEALSAARQEEPARGEERRRSL